jgi:acetyl esterase/lipase
MNDGLKVPMNLRHREREGRSMVPPVSEARCRRVYYGPDASQYADLHWQVRPHRRGTIALFHGGWWGPWYGSEILNEVAADLVERGWVVWNVEYRRLGLGGGYPSTLEDVASAIDHLRVLTEVGTERVVAVGHSAGGHLATWAAGRSRLTAGAPGAAPVVELAGVVSLAGVVDLGGAAREKIGHGAALEFIGGTPFQWPERYAVADPLSQVPIPALVRCVHARADALVPFTQSVNYVEAARAAGQDARLLEVEGDHFSVADPSSSAWPIVIRVLEELLGTSGES